MWKLIERILVIACGLELVDTFDVIEAAEVSDVVVECPEIETLIEDLGDVLGW